MRAGKGRVGDMKQKQGAKGTAELFRTLTLLQAWFLDVAFPSFKYASQYVQLHQLWLMNSQTGSKNISKSTKGVSNTRSLKDQKHLLEQKAAHLCNCYCMVPVSALTYSPAGKCHTFTWHLHNKFPFFSQQCHLAIATGMQTMCNQQDRITSHSSTPLWLKVYAHCMQIWDPFACITNQPNCVKNHEAKMYTCKEQTADKHTA